MRYAVSGSLGTALAEVTGPAQNLLGKAITTGRVLWLRSLWALATASGGSIMLMDQVVTATATSVESTSRFRMFVASTQYAATTMVVYTVGPYGKVDFPAPGIKFALGCAVGLEGGCTALAIGHAGGMGYEE